MPFNISTVTSKLKSANYNLEDASNKLTAASAAFSLPAASASTQTAGSMQTISNNKHIIKQQINKCKNILTNKNEDAFDGSDAAIYGVSINTASSNNNQLSYVPSMETTKSLALDIIQLTRFKNRRPTILDETQHRKPSFRNMFLGVPEIRRRFSHDIRSESVANLANFGRSKKHNNIVGGIGGGVGGCGGGGGLGGNTRTSIVGHRMNVGANKETKRVLLLQVFVPFLLSGFGNVGAGLFLNYAQTWTVFRESSMFYMLLATVMAFKTNLEATLAARLSTCSNMGSIRGKKKKFEAFFGNLSLVMTQSIIFGFMSGLTTVLVRSIQNGSLNLSLGAQVIATSMTAIVVNELLSSLIILGVVVASERAGVNPDNVSTLIAAMLGDLSSVFFVSITAACFHALDSTSVTAAATLAAEQQQQQQAPSLVSSTKMLIFGSSSSTATVANNNFITLPSPINKLFVAIIVALFAFLPITCYVSTKNVFTSNMFLPTHLPLTLAVIVATLSGCVFDHAIRTFSRIAIYQAVVNGISVNLMAVQASRISTYMQQLNNVSPQQAQKYAKVYWPFKALYANDMNASVSRWLIVMCVPAISVYLCFIFIVCPKDVDITFYFLACCFISIIVQITAVQCLTYMVTPFSWRMDWDPDNVVIPILMSISDCLGNAILLSGFMFLKYLGDPNSVGQLK